MGIGIPLRFGGHPDAVDLHIILHGNHQAASSVDDSCFHQLRPVRIYVDYYIRSFDFHSSCIGDVGSHESGIFPGSGLIAGIKSFQLFLLDSALFKETFDFRLCENGGLRGVFLGFHPFVQLFVDIHNGIVSAVFPQGFFYQGIERIPLPACGKRSGAAKEFIYKRGAELLRVF